jgi:hypothetical protein
MAKHKSSQSQPRFNFPARTPQHGDLVQRKDSASTYQIIHIAYDGKTVTLCLMQGGSPTNFELRNIPVENLVWHYPDSSRSERAAHPAASAI